MKFFQTLKKYYSFIFPTQAVFCDSSTVSRFTKDSCHIKRKEGVITITPDAFIYPEGVKEISLAHIDRLCNKKIWFLGDNEVFKNTKPKRNAVARADMNVGKLKNCSIIGFDIKRDDLEFDRHVTAYSNMEKYLFATKLSLNCSVIVR